jgi:hypothetical protein
MSVRFERDIRGRADGARAGLLERQRLGVLDALVQVKAFTDYSAVCICNHAADERTRADSALAARGQFESAHHHAPVIIAPRAHVRCRRRLFSLLLCHVPGLFQRSPLTN